MKESLTQRFVPTFLTFVFTFFSVLIIIDNCILFTEFLFENSFLIKRMLAELKLRIRLYKTKITDATSERFFNNLDVIMSCFSTQGSICARITTKDVLTSFCFERGTQNVGHYLQDMLRMHQFMRKQF